MRYKKVTVEYDNKLWETGETLSDISKRTGIPCYFLSQLKNNRVAYIPTERKYLEYRKKILGY